MKDLKQSSTKNNKKTLLDKIIDPIALGGLGAGLGIGGRTLYSYIKSDIKDPIYNPSLTDLAKKDYYDSLKSKNKFFKSLLLAGGVGALLGGTTGLLKKEPLPTEAKAVGLGAALAESKWLHGKRGTIHILKNKLDDIIDPWRGKSGISQFFTSEKWVPNKNYDFKLEPGEIYSDAVQKAFIKEKPKNIENLLKKYENTQVGTRNLDEVLAQDIYSKGIAQGKYGADPELNLVIQGRNKKLPVHLSIFPGDNYNKIPNLTNDFSVAGAELNNVPPGTPDELSKTLKDMENAVQSRFEGTKVKIDPLSIVPLDSKITRAYSRKTAGGHIHVGFDVPKGIDEKEERLKLQKRLALLLTPIDLTHPAMPVRSEVFGKYPTIYGSSIIDKRALERASWTPHGGFTDTSGNVVRSNMEIRTAPSYIGDNVALNKKLKLIELATKHPNAYKLDELADEVYRLSNNSSKNLYNKDVAKLHNKGLKKILAEEMNMQDDWYDNILTLREKGDFRQIGR